MDGVADQNLEDKNQYLFIIILKYEILSLK